MPSPDNYRRNVIDAAAWAVAHQRTLKVIYEEFVRSADWPKLDDLQRDLDRRNENIDLAREVREMPPSLGGGGFPEGIYLSVRGFSHVPEARPLLEHYMGLIRVAVERYRSDDPSPVVTDEDLAALGVEAHERLLVAQILFRDGWPFGGGGGFAVGPWTREVGREVRNVQGAQTIDDLLAVQASLRYGPPSEPDHQPPAPDSEPKPEEQASSQPSDIPDVEQPGNPRVLTAEGPGDPTEATQVTESTSDRGRTRPDASRSRRPLTNEAFIRLVFKALAQANKEGLHVEAFRQGGDGNSHLGPPEPPKFTDPEHWLMMTFGIAGIWGDLEKPRETAEALLVPVWADDRELLLEVLELWHRDVVSTPSFDSDGSFDGWFVQVEGQTRFRELVNPVLRRLDPPPAHAWQWSDRR